jgi:3-oxoacyl-[acyl-carrier protein] reductase
MAITAWGSRVVFVTGAAGGIGRQLCHKLASHGCKLGLMGRDESQLRQLASELSPSGAEAAWAVADMRDRAAVEAAVKSLIERFGKVDILINNAAVCRVTQAAAPNVEDIEEMLEVNYLGGVYATAAVLPSMLAQGAGHLVALSSLASLRGMAWTAGYSAGKAAFDAFLESLRPALRPRGIAATSCFMGFVGTQMCKSLPMDPRIWKIGPERAADKIIAAIARKRREAYFPWYDACAARALRRLPAWAFDAVMNFFGPIMVKGDY